MKTLNHFQKTNMSKTRQGTGIAIDFMYVAKDAKGEENTDNLKENVRD